MKKVFLPIGKAFVIFSMCIGIVSCGDNESSNKNFTAKLKEVKEKLKSLEVENEKLSEQINDLTIPDPGENFENYFSKDMIDKIINTAQNEKGILRKMPFEMISSFYSFADKKLFKIDDMPNSIPAEEAKKYTIGTEIRRLIAAEHDRRLAIDFKNKTTCFKDF